MNYSCVFFGILFTAVGLLFIFGKAHKYIRAWKNMPDDEKRTVRILPLCRNIGEIILLNGIIFLLKGFWASFSDHGFTAAMIAWLMVAGLDVWYISRSGRYNCK